MIINKFVIKDGRAIIDYNDGGNEGTLIIDAMSIVENHKAAEHHAHLTWLESRPFCTNHEIHYDPELGCPACPAPQVA